MFHHKSAVAKSYLLIFLLLLGFFSITTAQAESEFDDEEKIVVFLNKIRDNGGNYLADVTKATARALSRTGEYLVKKYKKNKYNGGAIISITSPMFEFMPHTDGMSTKEITNASLGLITSLGELFGKDKEAAKMDEFSESLNTENSILDTFDDDEQIKITMKSKVDVYDESTGSEVTRRVIFEKIFPNKTSFLNEKEEIIESQIIKNVKLALVEYVDETE